ncbi:hypothetical protein CYCD_08340 [Tenuifilaceae bacterium CYCD]|nr:hypothetical protein CYCD_08340 [Tenuifilaceae bacterium CYCD]
MSDKQVVVVCYSLKHSVKIIRKRTDHFNKRKKPIKVKEIDKLIQYYVEFKLVRACLNLVS